MRFGQALAPPGVGPLKGAHPRRREKVSVESRIFFTTPAMPLGYVGEDFERDDLYTLRQTFNELVDRDQILLRMVVELVCVLFSLHCHVDPFT